MHTSILIGKDLTGCHGPVPLVCLVWAAGVASQNQVASRPGSPPAIGIKPFLLDRNGLRMEGISPAWALDDADEQA